MNKRFAKWLIQKPYFGLNADGYTIKHFNNLPFSMQYGVYLEYFDSVGIYLFEIDGCSFSCRFGWDVYKWEFNESDGGRFLAQQEAIKKAFEILENS